MRRGTVWAALGAVGALCASAFGLEVLSYQFPNMRWPEQATRWSWAVLELVLALAILAWVMPRLVRSISGEGIRGRVRRYLWMGLWLSIWGALLVLCLTAGLVALRAEPLAGLVARLGLAEDGPGVLLETVLATALLVYLVALHRRLMGLLYYFASSYIVLTLVVVLMYGVVFGLVGTSNGVPFLFWHDSLWTRMLAAMSVTMLFAHIWTIGYYVDPEKDRTQEELKAFLDNLPAWMLRLLRGPDDRPPHPVRRVVRWMAPTTGVRQPGGEDNIVYLGRFLGVTCLPFLVVLMAPAVFPRVFQAVPRTVPNELLPLVGDEGNDIWKPPARLLAMIPWVLGIVAGAVATLLLLKAARRLHHGLVVPAVDFLARVVGEPREAAPHEPGRNGHGPGPGHGPPAPAPATLGQRTRAAIGQIGTRALQTMGQRVVGDYVEASRPAPGPAVAELGGGVTVALAVAAPPTPAPAHAPPPLLTWRRFWIELVGVVLVLVVPASIGLITRGPLVLESFAGQLALIAPLYVAALWLLVFLARLPATLFARHRAENAEPEPPDMTEAERDLWRDLEARREAIRCTRLRDEARRRAERRLSIVTFFTTIGLIALVVGLPNWLRPFLGHEYREWYQDYYYVPSAMLICLLLVVLGAVYAFIAYFRSYVLYPLALALVLLGLVSNASPYKIKFPHMVAEYDARGDEVANYGEAVAKYAGTDPELSWPDAPVRAEDSACGLAARDTDADALECWRRHFGLPEPRPGSSAGRPKLVVVATSGGAVRSGLWTAVVLQTLEAKLPGAAGKAFHDHVRLMTGASGGMVGSAFYVAEIDRALKEKRPPRIAGAYAHPAGPGAKATATVDQPLADQVRTDSLSAIAQQVVLGDLPASFCPIVQTSDRGTELDRTWGSRRNGLDVPFVELGPNERAGLVPSLVLSPMLVEDGRRLLISNLDLRELATTRGELVLNGSDQPFSVTAVEFYKLFPRATDFRLATAVRMSATFPYVSPAVSLPCAPSRRVVDAGYYDNYGIVVAAAWMEKHRDWLLKNTSGVVLVQVRAYVGQDDRLGVSRRDEGLWAAASRGLQFFTSPLEGIGAARYASNSFRNDAELAALDRRFGELACDQGDFFTTAIFENSADVGLNWYVTRKDKVEIARSIGYRFDPATRQLVADNPFRNGPAVDPLERERSRSVASNQRTMDKLLEWWQEDHTPQGQ